MVKQVLRCEPEKWKRKKDKSIFFSPLESGEVKKKGGRRKTKKKKKKKQKKPQLISPLIFSLSNVAFYGGEKE